MKVLSGSFTAQWLWVWLLPVVLLGVFCYRQWQSRTQVKVTSTPQKPVHLQEMSYVEGEVSELLFRSPQQGARPTENATAPSLFMTTSPILACLITKRLPKNPVVVSCGKVFEKSALASYLRDASHLRQDLGLAYTPGASTEPFFMGDKGYGNPLRQHKVLQALLAWWSKQSRTTQNLAQSQPELFFLDIDHAPIRENLALLMPGATYPEGFLETWYDPAVFFKDPVIDEHGSTIELPAYYQAVARTRYRYNDMTFCTAGPEGLTTVIDRTIWMKPREDEAARPDIVSSFYDLSKLKGPDQNDEALVSRYYQDSVVDRMIQQIKPCLQAYAEAENLSRTCPVNQLMR